MQSFFFLHKNLNIFKSERERIIADIIFFYRSKKIRLTFERTLHDNVYLLHKITRKKTVLDVFQTLCKLNVFLAKKNTNCNANIGDAIKSSSYHERAELIDRIFYLFVINSILKVSEHMLYLF